MEALPQLPTHNLVTSLHDILWIYNPRAATHQLNNRPSPPPAMRFHTSIALLALIANTVMAAPSHQELIIDSHDARLTHATSSKFDILVSIGFKKNPIEIQCAAKFGRFLLCSSPSTHAPNFASPFHPSRFSLLIRVTSSIIPNSLFKGCCWNRKNSAPHCVRCPGDPGTGPICHTGDCSQRAESDMLEMRAMGNSQ